MGGLWIEETEEGSTRDSSAARLAGASAAWRRPAGRFAPDRGPRPRQRGGGGPQTAGGGGAGAGENPRGDRTDRPINLSARLAVGTSTAQVGSATATGVALVEINEVP